MRFVIVAAFAYWCWILVPISSLCFGSQYVLRFLKYKEDSGNAMAFLISMALTFIPFWVWILLSEAAKFFKAKEKTTKSDLPA